MFIPIDRYLELSLTMEDMESVALSIYFANGKLVKRTLDSNPQAGEYFLDAVARIAKFSKEDAGREIRVTMQTPVPA